MATGQSLIRAEICKALSLPLEEISSPVYDGVWCNYIVHSDKEGTLDAVDIDERFRKKYVKNEGLIVNSGDHIVPFNGANNSLGTLFLRAEDREEMDSILAAINNYIKIKFI